MSSALRKALRSGRKTIAVDADDVLCCTNETVAEMYNELFDLNPPMTIDDFQHYLYWSNRGWGTPAETAAKIRRLYAEGLMKRTPPIHGAKEALLELKSMGFNLVLITARAEYQRQATEEWLQKYMPDIFERAFFTGAFVPMQDPGQANSNFAIPPKKSKAEIAHAIDACCLIDDSLENALSCAAHEPPLPVILFGHYPWNSNLTEEDTPLDPGAHRERIARAIESPEAEQLALRLEQQRKIEGRLDLPIGITRVRTWEEVVELVRAGGA